MDLILKYFPSLSETQRKQYEELSELYGYWNERINLISRKDIEHLYEKHVLHSLSIAKIIQFKKGTKILDVGTGGGFPGIPLAILFPETNFYLIDSIGKKIKVVNAISDSLKLQNIQAKQIRAEEIKERFDFITGRAVAALPDFLKLIKNKISANNFNELRNGLLYLKGGDVSDELKQIQQIPTVFNLSEFFEEEYFETKKIIYLPI